MHIPTANSQESQSRANANTLNGQNGTAQLMRFPPRGQLGMALPKVLPAVMPGATARNRAPVQLVKINGEEIDKDEVLGDILAKLRSKFIGFQGIDSILADYLLESEIANKSFNSIADVVDDFASEKNLQMRLDQQAQVKADSSEDDEDDQSTGTNRAGNTSASATVPASAARMPKVGPLAYLDMVGENPADYNIAVASAFTRRGSTDTVNWFCRIQNIHNQSETSFEIHVHPYSADIGSKSVHLKMPGLPGYYVIPGWILTKTGLSFDGFKTQARTTVNWTKEEQKRRVAERKKSRGDENR